MLHFIMPKLNFHVERWKWNKEYRIYVSTLGHFKDEYKNPIPAKVTNSGYLTIKTGYGFKLAHRLVMFTWCPTPNMESLTVDHLNHNKRDNSLENLEWVTRRENQRRANEDFLTKAKVRAAGPSGKQIRCNETGTIFNTLKEAAIWLKNSDDIFLNNIPLTVPVISKGIRKGLRCSSPKKQNMAYGYHWSYVQN